MNKYVLFVLSIATLIVVTACGPLPGRPTGAATDGVTSSPEAGPDTQSSEATPSPQPTPAPAPTPAQGGKIVIGGLDSPTTLNPLLAETRIDGYLAPLVYDSLLVPDPVSGRLVPQLAEDWEVAPDSRSFTFTLRSEVVWQDGQPLTAGDVAYSIQAARDPTLDSLYGPRLSHVVGVTSPTRSTLVVTLDAPDCPSLATVAGLPIVPRHVTQTLSLDSGPQINAARVGSGPFKPLVTTDGSVTFIANDGYWGQRPYLDEITYRAFENDTQLQQALQEGEVDVAWFSTPDSLSAASESSLPETGVSWHYAPLPEWYFVAFRNDYPPLQDSRVRRALSLAVDRQGILEMVLEGRGELAAGSLPVNHWAGDPEQVPTSYDPNEARRLLEEAGWVDTDGDGWLDRDGEVFKLAVRTDSGNWLRQQIAILVSGYYRAIGVQARVEIVTWPIFVDDLLIHDFETAVFSWPQTSEPDQRDVWLSSENQVDTGYNFVSFSDEQVDRLLGEAATVPGCSLEARGDLYRQVQQRLAVEQPYDFVLTPYFGLAARSHVHVGEPSRYLGPFWDVTTWWVN